MEQSDILKDLVVIFTAAVVVVTLLKKARVPSVAGFILTGVLAGPSALALVNDPHQVEILAEVGVILLLFGIGLELSMDRIRRLWKAILLGGGMQVTVTIIATTIIGYGLGLEFASAIFLGCIVAVSSTALVLHGLSSRGELETPHGRFAVGVLVFQDLCVVPMILALPILSGQGGSLSEILTTALTAGLIVTGVLLAARFLVPWVLGFVAQTRQRDLFVLSVFLVCFGTAWLVSQAQISLALGAFLAGLVVAGSEFRHQALSDLIAIRDLFASLFFVSVGMLLNVADVMAHGVQIAGLLTLILVGKFLVILGTARVMRMPLRVAVLSAATLCQVGEFSFVLLKAGSHTGLLNATWTHNLLVAVILSMLLTPLCIAMGPRLARYAARWPRLAKKFSTETTETTASTGFKNHVVVAGYGPTGQAVCHALRSQDTPYLVVDMNPDNVKQAKARGEQAVFGDITQAEMRDTLGCQHARLIVLAINDARATELALKIIRETCFTPIIVRTQYQVDEAALHHAGATHVVVAETTASDALVDAATTAARLPAGLVPIPSTQTAWPTAMGQT